jgi:tRNA A-37 threonylcarbamoyl transferase component Bud32
MVDNGRRIDKIDYWNGDVYEGEVLDGKPDGEGVFIQSNINQKTNYEYHG